MGVTPEQLPKAPPTALHVLLLEDSAVDADLILHELRQGGYEPVARRVASRGEMLEAVNDGSWQIVLLDYSMEGGGTALDALASLAALDIDLPAILISGEIGVEEAADALRAGARDFVNKGNLTRLVPAVARELAQVEARRQRREDEEALRQSEQRLRLALDAGGMGSWEWDLASGRIHWSETLELMVRTRAGRVRRDLRGVHRARPSRRPRPGRGQRRRGGRARLPCGRLPSPVAGRDRPLA